MSRVNRNGGRFDSRALSRTLRRGGEVFSQNGITGTFNDARGKTSNRVTGNDNRITFQGDHGRNRFEIGGHRNNVTVKNLGGDDRVHLQGDGWREVASSAANRKDGVLVFENTITGSVVTVRTDRDPKSKRQRNDQFVRERVHFSRGPSPAPAAAPPAAPASVPSVVPAPPPAPVSAEWVVKRLGEDLISVNNGSRGFILRDANRNGRVDNGDLIVGANRGDSSVISHVLGTGESLISHNDPHLDNIKHSEAGDHAIRSRASALLADIADGKLDNADLASSLDTALRTGTVDRIGDFHVDVAFTLADNKTSIEHKVAGSAGARYTDAFDIQFADGRSVTVSDLWAGNGGTGVSIQDTSGNWTAQAMSPGANVAKFVEVSGASLFVVGSTAEVGPAVNGGKSAGLLADERGAVLGVGTQITARAQNMYGTLARGDALPLEIAYGLRSPENS